MITCGGVRFVFAIARKAHMQGAVMLLTVLGDAHHALRKRVELLWFANVQNFDWGVERYKKERRVTLTSKDALRRKKESHSV